MLIAIEKRARVASPQVAVSPLGVDALVCKKSFFEFLKKFWYVVIPEKPVWNWHIPYLCNELQKMAEEVFLGLPKKYDFLCNIPPGTTKSTICSIMFPAWCWTRMPSCRFICGSFAEKLALDLSRKCRDIVQSDLYKEMFPGIDLRDDQNTKGYFANVHGGIRYAVGVGGSVIGMHGHFLIVDDPIDPLKVISEAELKEVNLWMSEQLSQRKVDKAVTPLVLIMQRLHQDDPAGNLLDRFKYKMEKLRHICLPAEKTKNVRPMELRTRYRHGLLDPVRLSRSNLSNALSELLEYGYSGQFLQDPIPPGGAMFKVEKINTVPFNKVPPVFVKVVRFWDKAATKGGGAYTVGVKMGLDKNGYFWFLHVIRGQWDTATREGVILRTADTDGKSVVVGLEQEPGSGGKESVEHTTRALAGFVVKVVRPTGSEGSKVIRADPLSTQVNAGNCYMVEAPWNDDFVSEMSYFPFGKYKDQIDGASGAFTVLSQRRVKVGAFFKIDLSRQ